MQLVERGFTVDEVLKRVRHDIITGRYPPESQIYPKAIAVELGTSFIPVREALRILESEGFVTFVNNRGTWVTPLSLEDANDLYSTRIELESQVVRMSEPFSPAELDELDGLLDELGGALMAGETRRVVELNREFHFSLYRKSRSPRRIRLIEHLWLHSQRYQALSVEQRDDAGDREHRDILTALRRGDHGRAGDLLGEHLRTTIVLINREYAGRRGAPTP
ncbi:MAG: GntR family transcriptional regulator [Acidobacteria bacterium]|nr:GntR family transcriptional regulator [Acidobacteriota bacterium]